MDQDLLVREFDIYTGTDAQGSSVHGLGRIEEPMRLSQNLLRMVSFLLLAGLGVACFLWWQGQPAREITRQTGLGAEHVEVEGADGTTQIHPLDEPEDQAVAEAQSEAASPPVEVSPELAAQPGTVAPTDPQGAAPAAPTAQASPPAAVAVAPANAPVAPPVAQATPEASAPVLPGEGQVGLKFTADCWTQLKDAQGKVLVSALKRAGDSLVVTGKPPLELRLGFARGAQVSFNGQPVDIAPFVSGETARVKLGQ
jgi:cytoskeleton protein RodZ